MTKEFKFTPGPWGVDPNGWVQGSADINASDWIALATVVTTGEYGQPMRDGEGHANARLISKSPELCEALESLVEAYDSCATDDVIWDRVATAKQVLAEVRGEQC